MTRGEARIDAATDYGYQVAGGCLERPNISTAFRNGAVWADRTILDRACEWLRENTYFFVNDNTGNVDEERLIFEFRKAMEE